VNSFGETLKLYYKREQNLVTLSFLVSPTYVQTYYFERDEFEKIIGLPDRGMHERPGFFVHRKREYLRWSFDTQGMTHQIRIELGKWDDLIAQYREKITDTAAPLITCIVR